MAPPHPLSPPPTAATAQRVLFFDPTVASPTVVAMPLPPPATALSLPADAIDENLLLAETEELLAALDATAFVSSPASTEDDNEEEEDEQSGDVARATPPPAPALAAAHAAAAQVTTLATTSKKRVRSRDRTKDELLELRRSVVDLEKHLVALRRNTTVVGKGKRNVAQTWEHIARRQLRGRERAEQENQQLKAMLLGQLSLAGRLDQTSNKRQLVAFPDASGSPQRERPACPASHLANAAAMEALIGAVDGAYAQMDAVFKENEMDQWRREPRAYAQTKTRVSSATGEESSYLELVEVRLIPFHVRAVGDYLWQSMRSWHQKNNSYSFPCADRPDDTFAVSYRVESRLGPGQDKYSAAFKLVKRRYVRSESEVVVVWTSRSDGDKALAGVHTDEVGWVVVTAVPSVDDSEPPMTALRACVQICPQQTSGGRSDKPGSDASRSLLTDLVVGSFENDVNSINQAMEDLLMDDLRRPPAAPGGGSVTSSSSADTDAGLAATERQPSSERIHFAAL